jgi:hypothetical protein
MHLTQFVRDRTDVELERLTREGTRWHHMKACRFGDVTYQRSPGCLLCNAFDLRGHDQYWRAQSQHLLAESKYMGLAMRHGDAETGALIARLARRELGRRAIEAAYAVLASERTESREPEPVR